MNYRVADEDLVIEDADHKLCWRGRPEARPVEWATAIRITDDGLALYSRSEAMTYETRTLFAGRAVVR